MFKVTAIELKYKLTWHSGVTFCSSEHPLNPRKMSGSRGSPVTVDTSDRQTDRLYSYSRAL